MNINSNLTISEYMIEDIIGKYDLDLSGLTVLTECANGAYTFNPIILLKSNVEHVFLFTRDSDFGSKQMVYENFQNLLPDSYLSRVTFLQDLDNLDKLGIDIVTNSGHLRPMDRKFLQQLPTSAVISLMWETWEFRPEELDLEFCKSRDILVLGTNEHTNPCDMRIYGVLSALELLKSADFKFLDEKILLIGNQQSLGAPIFEGLKALGFQVKQYDPIFEREFDTKLLGWSTLILVAIHHYPSKIIDLEVGINVIDIAKAGIKKVAVISGDVDQQSLLDSNIMVFPEKLGQPGYMSFGPSFLGVYPVLDLFAAGVAVGQAMAKARKLGLDRESSIEYALNNSPAMNFIGDGINENL